MTKTICIVYYIILFVEIVLENNLDKGAFYAVNEIRCINLPLVCLNILGDLTKKEMTDNF